MSSLLVAESVCNGFSSVKNMVMFVKKSEPRLLFYRKKTPSVHSLSLIDSTYTQFPSKNMIFGQLSMSRWSQYILFLSSSQNEKTYVDFCETSKK